MSSINPLSIHTFVDGEVVTATDFNPTFSTIVGAVNDNYSLITANTASIAVNTANIATNTANIATNTASITVLSAQEDTQSALIWMGGF